MKIASYLVFNRKRILRTTTKVPDLRNGEYAVRVCLNAPDNLFKPETPNVEITIPPRDMIVPEVRIEPNTPPDPTL